MSIFTDLYNRGKQQIGSSIDILGRSLGNPLPDWNISEKLVGTANASSTPPGQTLGTSTNTQNSYNQNAYIPQSNVVFPGQGSSGSQGVVTPTTGNQPNYDQLNQQTNDFGAIIDQEYNNTMGTLGDQERLLQGQATSASGQIGNEYAGVKTQLGAEQATKEQGVQSELSTSEAQGKTSMQQARDLFRETQQQNIAQLSGLGISSSSVAEALAERLGVETARRIAGVSGSINEVRTNATKELGRIKNYFSEKLTNLENEKAVKLSEIQNSLMQGINQINSARNQAATAKAQQRLELFSNAQNTIANLTQQYQQFQQSLQQWAAEKQASLTPIAQDPNYVQKLISTANVFNEQFSPTGFNFAPSLSVDATGQMTGKVSSYKNDEDEELNF